jgi:hypothetical protein
VAVALLTVGLNFGLSVRAWRHLRPEHKQDVPRSLSEKMRKGAPRLSSLTTEGRRLLWAAYGCGAVFFMCVAVLVADAFRRAV